MDVPPVVDSYSPSPPPTGPSSPPPPKNAFQKAFGGLLAFIATVWKFIIPILQFGKFGKILLTMGSMFVSVWFYSLLFGWEFAFGFVICIFIHELGHVFAAWRMGMPVSAPIFIPGMGALILSKRMTDNAFDGAIM
jgi:hypothetical protein